MDLHEAYEAVAKELEATAAKYAAGNAGDHIALANSRLAKHFDKAREEIARGVNEAARVS